MKKLNVYVWHDVLTDYSSGMAVVVAESVEHARSVVIKSPELCDNLWGFEKEPICLDLTKPSIEFVYGGG